MAPEPFFAPPPRFLLFDSWPAAGVWGGLGLAHVTMRDSIVFSDRFYMIAESQVWFQLDMCSRMQIDRKI